MKVAVERELTKRNLSLLRSYSRQRIRRLFCLKRDGRRTSPEPESGQAILIRKIRALNLADILHLRKRSMVLFCALNRTTRLEQFQPAGPFSENSQKQ